MGALRGVMHFTATVQAGSKNLSSGSFGGTVNEAMTDAAALMSALTNTSPFFPQELDPNEMKNAESVAFDMDAYCKQLGATMLQSRQTSRSASRKLLQG